MKVLIAGATGLVGKALTQWLLQHNYEVVHLVRQPQQKAQQVPQFLFDINNGKIDGNCLKGVDYIVNLTGENIASQRWTTERKQQILHSRIKSVQLLQNLLNTQQHQVKCFINASAVGFYGIQTTENPCKEDQQAGTDFLAQVCQQWEQEVETIRSLGIRTIIFRLGVVLSAEGGALQKMIQPIQNYVGAALGSGKQYMPWVHIQDVCKAIDFAMKETSIQGIYNLVATEHVTNQEFTIILAKKLQKPILLPNIPSFLLKIILGELATALTSGNKVDNSKIKKAGFQFQYDKLESALDDCLKKKSNS